MGYFCTSGKNLNVYEFGIGIQIHAIQARLLDQGGPHV